MIKEGNYKMGNKLIVTGMVILIALGIIGVFNIDFDSKKCSYSQYNPSNVSGGKYFFGKCFVPYYETYESTEKCGFLSISCRTVEPYVKMNSGALCFKLKTGELC